MTNPTPPIVVSDEARDYADKLIRFLVHDDEPLDLLDTAGVAQEIQTLLNTHTQSLKDEVNGLTLALHIISGYVKSDSDRTPTPEALLAQQALTEYKASESKKEDVG